MSPESGLVFAFILRQPLVDLFAPLDVGVVVAGTDRADAELEKEVALRRDQHITPLNFVQPEETGCFQIEFSAASGHAAPRRGFGRPQRTVIGAVSGDVGFQLRLIGDLAGKVEILRLAETVDPDRDGFGLFRAESECKLLRAAGIDIGVEDELEDFPLPLPVVLKLPEALAVQSDDDGFGALRIGEAEPGAVELGEMRLGGLLFRKHAAFSVRSKRPFPLAAEHDRQEHIPDELAFGGGFHAAAQPVAVQSEFDPRGAVGQIGQYGFAAGVETRIGKNEFSHRAAVDFHAGFRKPRHCREYG